MMEINRALTSPDATSKFNLIGLTARQRSRAETVEFYGQDVKRWSEMVKATGLSM